MADLPPSTEKFVTHVVADASDDPECIDDCPGCHPGEERSARVFYDRETAKLIVRVATRTDEPPTDFDIASVTVELRYPDGSPNYGERNFRR